MLDDFGNGGVVVNSLVVEEEIYGFKAPTSRGRTGYRALWLRAFQSLIAWQDTCSDHTAEQRCLSI